MENPFGRQLFFILLATLCIMDSASEASGGDDRVGFVRTRGTQFVLDGSPFLFNGFNSYWMLHAAANPTERHKVTDVFLEASAAGLTVCRTWAFADGGDRALQVSPGVYDENVFQALDFVVSEARRFRIRVILSLANNFNDYGGRAQYVQWARNAGVPVNGDDDFYTNPTVKGYYRNHIQRVLTRFNTITKTSYRDDPTIMAWELINEPRCHSDYSGRTINEWVKEMAALVKSTDAKHLLEIGMEGFYGESAPEKKQNNPGYQVGTDFISSNLITQIDFATIHAYPDIWLSGQNEGSQTSFAQRWMWNHWIDARDILKKPLVFAEFGKSKKDPGYTDDERDLYFSAVYRDIFRYARFGGGGFAGGLVWQVMAEGMEAYYDGYEIILSRDFATVGIISRQSRAMSMLGRVMSRTDIGLHGERGQTESNLDKYGGIIDGGKRRSRGVRGGGHGRSRRWHGRRHHGHGNHGYGHAHKHGHA